MVYKRIKVVYNYKVRNNNLMEAVILYTKESSYPEMTEKAWELGISIVGVKRFDLANTLNQAIAEGRQPIVRGTREIEGITFEFPYTEATPYPALVVRAIELDVKYVALKKSALVLALNEAEEKAISEVI